MDVEWRDPEDVLAALRAEIGRSRAEDRGRFLKPLGELHARVGGKPRCFDAELYVALALQCLETASLFERMAFADVMADIGGIPGALVLRLLSDTHLVSRPLIERAKLSDGQLLEVIGRSASKSMLLAIAARPGMGLAVTDRLVELGPLEVHLTLAANDRSPLSPATFERFSDMAEAQNNMDLALAQRSDLPIEIAKALYQRLSERSAKRLSTMLARDLGRGRKPLALKVY